MSAGSNRRRFLGASLATGAVALVPRHVLGGEGYVPPSGKINVAQIGMGTQGLKEMGDLLADPRIQIVASCDPNRDSHDYVEWGKDSLRRRIAGYLGEPAWRQGRGGCPGGREVGKEIVDLYYAKHREAGTFKACKAYADFRELLENETDIDAVKVMTPDHLHATVAIAAMRADKHVLMHKPVANRMAEGRRVLEVAHETGRQTHLLAYGAGSGNGGIAEHIRQGVIGTLREIHHWTNRPVWPQYAEIPTERPAIPEGFDWDLWLGPAVDRPYHPHYTHTVFRGWYDFGGGSMADMGIYSLWPIFRAFDLQPAVRAEATATHACTIADGVSLRIRNDFSYPLACTLRFRFADQASMEGFELFWYDGGMRPRMPREIETSNVAIGHEGILYIGDDGMILADYHGSNARLFAGGEVKPFDVSEQAEKYTRPAKSHELWLGACVGGQPSPGNFLAASAITDTVNLGTVALRAGQPVEFDSKAMKITNVAAANRYLTREYRKGWEL